MDRGDGRRPVDGSKAARGTAEVLLFLAEYGGHFSQRPPESRLPFLGSLTTKKSIKLTTVIEYSVQ